MLNIDNLYMCSLNASDLQRKDVLKNWHSKAHTDYKNPCNLQSFEVFKMSLLQNLYLMSSPFIVIKFTKGLLLVLHGPICHVIGARSHGCPMTGIQLQLFVIGYL